MSLAGIIWAIDGLLLLIIIILFGKEIYKWLKEFKEYLKEEVSD